MPRRRNTIFTATLAAALVFPALAAAPGDYDRAVDLYRQGDYRAALALFQPLAQGDNHQAQYYLGLSHLTGRGVPLDDAKAVAWFRKAAEGGVADAAFVLADLYANGSGVAKDPAQAEQWLETAKRLNDDADWDSGCD